MVENKTKPEGGAKQVKAFLDSIPNSKKVSESNVLISMLKKITKCEPTMWGPSIIGFDSYSYTYDSGHSGTSCVLGFSPRASKFSIYFLDGFDKHEKLLKQLGKHKTAKSCLYVNKLDDIDLGVLESLLKASYKATKSMYK